ncbi:hypothetical protein GGR53DRAFT_464748 [Hypoxylon sp. FL1150]|nr:hypothetical protein GGR53DRAFT_464748 [Hypoxylon sp. FL1150]
MSSIDLLDLSDPGQFVLGGHPPLSTSSSGPFASLAFPRASHGIIGDARQTGYPRVHVTASSTQGMSTNTNTQSTPGSLPYPGPPARIVLPDLPGGGPRSSNVLDSPHIQANFIVSHTPEMAAGVLEAVHKELARADSGRGNVDCRQTSEGSYVAITAPAKNLIHLLDAARSMAEDLVSDNPTGRPSIFQEPPINRDSRIVLTMDPQANGVRPKLQEEGNSLKSLELPEGFQEYSRRLNEYAYRGLKAAGRIPLSLTLRAHLGHYLLRTYPEGKEVYEYDEFRNLITHPRASGCLKTRIGDEMLAQRVLDFARNSTNGLFQPTGNQASVAADILPEYAFEIHSQKAKFYTPLTTRTGLARKRGGVRGARGTDVCHPYRVITCGADATFAELDIVNLSVGKKLDWKFEAVNEEKREKSYPDIVKYLRSLEFDLESPCDFHNLNVYPRLHTENKTDFKSVASKLKDAAMKTIYNFRWKSTPYVVQIAINHRWDCLAAMKGGRPVVDLGISVFGEYWDLDDDAAGNIWGDELQLLLEGGGVDAMASGIDRVNNFLQVIRDVRDTIDSVF